MEAIRRGGLGWPWPWEQKETYWLTRFIMLRWLGFIYVVAFYVAVRQLIPLVGSNGLTPAPLFLERLRANGYDFFSVPMLFWFNCSDTALRVVPWIGLILSCVVLAGYANALMMATLWILYMSVAHVGQDWYGYGWEMQLSETGFLAIFLCPLLDGRPFPSRAPPLPVIFLFRWLIVRIMLGSALIKLRGDTCWSDFTALYYFFETQPIPNPVSSWFHFLPHPLLRFGVGVTYAVELVSPFFAFWPRWGRTMAGVMMAGFQATLIVSGNFSFFNWLTILPALACLDDRFWGLFLPTYLKSHATEARLAERPNAAMRGAAWAVTAVVSLLSIFPVANLISPQQMMNTSFEPFELVNTYGAFGTVGRDRPTIIFEGSDSTDPATATDWKEYPYVAAPWDPKRAPVQIAPYQPHLDWQLWFAAMDDFQHYPWTLNLVWKLLHNDPDTLSLFGGNPFPDHPPRYIRAVLYNYKFAKPGNPEHAYWTRERLGLWLPPLSAADPELKDVLRQEGWLK
ncbi:MAG TPA: lipase maturation factor family protein [Candidatus Methylacidiphilales bacterium]|nr:lipase maturation factor family protein [Candidatus Methylacidiphilales bacterium]